VGRVGISGDHSALAFSSSGASDLADACLNRRLRVWGHGTVIRVPLGLVCWFQITLFNAIESSLDLAGQPYL
jgi:hypothetical protein